MEGHFPIVVQNYNDFRNMLKLRFEFAHFCISELKKIYTNSSSRMFAISKTRNLPNSEERGECSGLHLYKKFSYKGLVSLK